MKLATTGLPSASPAARLMAAATSATARTSGGMKMTIAESVAGSARTALSAAR